MSEPAKTAAKEAAEIQGRTEELVGALTVAILAARGQLPLGAARDAMEENKGPSSTGSHRAS